MRRSETDVEEEGQTQPACTNCSRVIRLGEDTITAERGVIGPRGNVPLDRPLTFCSDDCVSSFFNGTPAEDLPEVLRREPY